MAANAIEFYFDFSSPFGYFAATKIKDIGDEFGREILWKPFMIGAALKVTGGMPLPMIPLKGDYSSKDMERTSRQFKIPYKVPSKFPISSQAPCRLVYWMQTVAPEKQEEAILKLYQAYFLEDLDISTPEVAAKVLSTVNGTEEELIALTQDPAMKQRLKDECNLAIEKGVFGSPFIIVDGEPFWGFDRLEQVREWLRTGGF
jgi:2-hydroxychromene-2-carboxylate isomerase